MTVGIHGKELSDNKPRPVQVSNQVYQMIVEYCTKKRPKPYMKDFIEYAVEEYIRQHPIEEES